MAILALASGVSLSGCVTTGGDPDADAKPARVELPPLPELSAEEAEIAVAAIRKVVRLEPGEFLHVSPRIGPPKMRSNPFTDLGLLEESTATDFSRKLNQQCLMPSQGLPGDLIVDWTGEVSGFLQAGQTGWTGYYARNPDSKGHVEISRVGLSPDGGQALVYIGHQEHWVEGSGKLLLLQRSGSGWSVVDSIHLWGT